MNLDGLTIQWKDKEPWGNSKHYDRYIYHPLIPGEVDFSALGLTSDKVFRMDGLKWRISASVYCTYKGEIMCEEYERDTDKSLLKAFKRVIPKMVSKVARNGMSAIDKIGAEYQYCEFKAQIVGV